MVSGAHRVAIVVSTCIALLGMVGVASWAGDAGTDATVRDAGARDAGVDAPTEPSASEQLAILTAKRDALQALLLGKLPDELYTTELFAIDLHDETAVARRRAELAARVEPVGVTALDGGVTDAGGTAGQVRDAGIGSGEAAITDELAEREREVDRLRLAFLRLPLDRRNAVLAAEEGARKSALDRAAAAAEMQRAEAERQRAEAAQRMALAQAEQAHEATERIVANERARIEGARAAIAEQRVQLSRLRAKRSADATASHALVFSLTENARRVTPGAAADALYDRVVHEVEAARDRLSADLDRLDARSVTPAFELSSALQDSTDPELATQRPGLEGAVLQIDSLDRQLDADRAAMERQTATGDADDAESLNAVRIELLDQLSPDKRSRTLGFGDEGREQLRRELTHLALLARWNWRAKRPAVVEAVESLAEPQTLIWFSVRAIAIFVVVLFARWILLAGRRRLRGLPASIVRSVRRPILAKLALGTIGLLATIWTPLIVLVALQVCSQVAAPLLATPMLSVPFELVMSLFVYRMFVAVTYKAIHKIQGGTIWSVAVGERVLASVHFVGRIAFTFYVLSVISAAILGRGYLFHLVIRIATLAILPLALVLFARWRGDIVDAYLKRRPTGWLADLVDRSRDHWYGFFLAIAAFALVLVQWLASGVRRFALSFDQTRKALAYLFRRRLERRHDDGDSGAAHELPSIVRAALSPVIEPESHELLVPMFPELERFRADVAAWQQNAEQVGSWIVVGKSGMGKSTWIHGAVIAAGLPAITVTLPSRIIDPAVLVDRLASLFEAEHPREADVIAAIRRGPRRLIVIDDVQRLALRGVGQLEVWALLCRVIEGTHDLVYWLAGCSYYAEEYLTWVRRGPSVFRGSTKLAAWTEPQIQALLDARIVASGWHVDYDDLMSIQVDPSQHAVAVANTAREYARLIWDYSEGSPRAALDCWARSLVPAAAQRLRVRLFPRPPDRQLELLDEVSRMVLAAMVWHEQVSLDHLVITLRFSRSQCDLALRQLRGAGVIERTVVDEYVVATAWWPAVTRYLMRKHLIEN